MERKYKLGDEVVIRDTRLEGNRIDFNGLKGVITELGYQGFAGNEYRVALPTLPRNLDGSQDFVYIFEPWIELKSNCKVFSARKYLTFIVKGGWYELVGCDDWVGDFDGATESKMNQEGYATDDSWFVDEDKYIPLSGDTYYSFISLLSTKPLTYEEVCDILVVEREVTQCQ